MLAGNQLRALPAEIAQCKRLALLRLSCNRLEALPPWLFTLPQLAFLSFASNPCASPTVNGARTPPGLASIAWSDLEVLQPLGSGASGVTSQGLWKQSQHYSEEVAVRLFRGSVTSDGSPLDEMAACLAAGAHESLVTVLGRVHGHPDEEDATGSGGAGASFQDGIVTQLLPPHYAPLAQPPSLETCTRDRFPSRPQQPANQGEGGGGGGTALDMDTPTALAMLTGIAGAAAHLHARGIAHGGLYAHNILAGRAEAHAVLGGFGAATIYGSGQERGCGGIERIEVLALAQLVEDVLGLVKREDPGGEEVRRALWELHARCAAPEVGARPGFEEVVEVLEGMMRWRGMMRIPGQNGG